jgi:urease accessory protein
MRTRALTGTEGATAARITVAAVRGRARLTGLDHGEYLSPRLLGTDPDGARVALVANRASVLAGDRVGLEVSVGSGARLELSEPAGTVAYNSWGAQADYRVAIQVAAGGLMVWDGAPLVVASGAALRRTVIVDIERGGRALIRDLLVLGRSYEQCGGRVVSRLRVTYDGAPLLVEDLDLWDRCARHAPGILGPGRVVSTGLLLGSRPGEGADAAAAGGETGAAADAGADTYVTALAGPGSLARAVTAHAHLATAELDPVWQRWRHEARRPNPAHP